MNLAKPLTTSYYHYLFVNISSSNDGGSILMTYVKNSYFSNVSFINSVAFSNGGSVFCVNQCKAVYENCSFLNSTSLNNIGGAIYTSGETQIMGNTFENCSSLKNGGSVYIGNCQYHISKSVFINSRSSNQNGGALYLNLAYTVSDCMFISCSAELSSGGAIYISNSDGSQFLLAGSLFYNCSSKNNGGAVYLDNQNRVQIERICFSNCYTKTTSSRGVCIFHSMASTTSNQIINIESVSSSNCGKTNYGDGMLYLLRGQQRISNNNYSSCNGYYNAIFNIQPYGSINIHFNTISQSSSSQSACITIQSLSTAPMASISFCNIIGNSVSNSIFYISNYGSRAVFQYLIFKWNNATNLGLIYNEYSTNQGYVSVLNTILFANNGILGNGITSEAITSSNAQTFTLTFYSTFFCQTLEIQLSLEVPCQTLSSCIIPPSPTQCNVISENNPLISYNIIYSIIPLTYLLFTT